MDNTNTTIEDRSRNGVRVIVYRTFRNGEFFSSSTDMSCSCMGMNRVHSNERCPNIPRPVQSTLSR